MTTERRYDLPDGGYVIEQIGRPNPRGIAYVCAYGYDRHSVLQVLGNGCVRVPDEQLHFALEC